MKSYKMLANDALCDELLKHYLGEVYYLSTKASVKCVTKKVTATTLDEYIKLLAEGYINAKPSEGLETYLDEVLEDEWFHKWPLVRWIYAKRSLERKTDITNRKRKEANIDYEISILDSLAKEGWPGAITDIGLCGLCGRIPTVNYECAICMWIYASRKGYQAARLCLYAQLKSREYANLCDELKLFVIDEAMAWFLENNNATRENFEEKLDGWCLKHAKELRAQSNRLQKAVSNKTFLRKTVGVLGWPDGDGPYAIKY